MKQKLSGMVQPSLAGSKGGATTLLYVVLIVTLWLSITGRAEAIRKAVSAPPPSGSATPPPQTEGTPPVAPAGVLPPALPHQNPDGSWSMPGMHGPIGGHGH